MSTQIRHIGVVFAICNRKLINKESLREDLGYERYKGLGTIERFKDEKEYRICSKCLAKIKKQEER